MTRNHRAASAMANQNMANKGEGMMRWPWATMLRNLGIYGFLPNVQYKMVLNDAKNCEHVHTDTTASYKQYCPSEHLNRDTTPSTAHQ